MPKNVSVTYDDKVKVVSMAQARVALLAAGLLASVEAVITAAKGNDPAIGIAWDKATELRRDSPMVLQLAGVLHLSDAQLDTLFEEAGKVRF